MARGASSEATVMLYGRYLGLGDATVLLDGVPGLPQATKLQHGSTIKLELAAQEKLRLPGHVMLHSRRVGSCSWRAPLRSVAREDVVQAPHLLEIKGLDKATSSAAPSPDSTPPPDASAVLPEENTVQEWQAPEEGTVQEWQGLEKAKRELASDVSPEAQHSLLTNNLLQSMTDQLRQLTTHNSLDEDAQSARLSSVVAPMSPMEAPVSSVEAPAADEVIYTLLEVSNLPGVPATDLPEVPPANEILADSHAPAEVLLEAFKDSEAAAEDQHAAPKAIAPEKAAPLLAATRESVMVLPAGFKVGLMQEGAKATAGKDCQEIAQVPHKYRGMVHLQAPSLASGGPVEFVVTHDVQVMSLLKGTTVAPLCRLVSPLLARQSCSLAAANRFRWTCLWQSTKRAWYTCS